MDKFDKYIDNLFEQKLSSASMPDVTAGTEWIKIGKVLQKKTFLKFSLAKFNVYYLSSLIVATVITGAVLFPPLLNSDKNELTPVEFQPALVDSIESIICIPIDNDTLDIDVDTLKREVCRENKESFMPREEIKSYKIEKEKVVVEKEQSFQESIKSQAELKPLVKELNDSAICNQQHPEILPISTRDTIFVADTIRIVKKRTILRREK